MGAPRAWWDRTWFPTTTTYHYGVFRILFVGGYFLAPELIAQVWPGLLQGSRVAALSALGEAPERLAQPVLLLRLVPLPVVPPGWLAPVIVLLAILATAGIATRASLVALAATYLYAGSALTSFGFIYHDTTLPALVLIVLAAAPGASALSLGAATRSRPRWPQSWTGFGARVPVWPARLILVVLALVYFASGYSKVRESGLAWADGSTLQAYATDPQPAPYFLEDPDADRATFRDGVGLESFLYSSGHPTALLKLVAGSSVVMAVLSTFSLLWELTFPVVLVARRLLPWYLAAGVFFHATVALTFGLTSFYSYPLTYLVFVDWNHVLGAMQRRLGRQPRPAATAAGHRAR